MLQIFRSTVRNYMRRRLEDALYRHQHHKAEAEDHTAKAEMFKKRAERLRAELDKDGEPLRHIHRHVDPVDASTDLVDTTAAVPIRRKR